jgi:hypothetical protein
MLIKVSITSFDSTMELTILLSKVFGLYLIIVGLAIMLRQRYFMPVFGGFVHDRLMRAVVAVTELLGGLFLVVTHSFWSTLQESVISLFGWMAVLEASFYLLASDETVEKMFKLFNIKAWYTYGGLGSVILGIYMAGSGFGFF